MTRALLQRGSASLYLPRFPYRTARLFNVAATCIKQQTYFKTLVSTTSRQMSSSYAHNNY